jgi:hypothetical protein
VTRLPSERERGAELNRILRGKTKPGLIHSWQSALCWAASLAVGLLCWWLIWLVVSALWRAL